MLRHRESGLVLAPRCDVASTWSRRCRGWLGRRPAVGDALWLAPCAAVQTVGMRVPIDVVFCAADGTVIAVARALRPWLAAWARGAAAACELPAGSARAVVPGDHLDRVVTRPDRTRLSATRPRAADR